MSNVHKVERHKKIVLNWLIQVRMQSELDTFWTHQDRINNGVFSLNLSNDNRLDILMLILPVYICRVVLIVYNFTTLIKTFHFQLD